MSSAEITRLVIIGLAAYALGNINPAIILGKLRGIDIRRKAAAMPE